MRTILKDDLGVPPRCSARQLCLRVWRVARLVDEISRGFLVSGTNAQSPTAQTSGQSGTRKNWFTTNRPRSFAQGSDEMMGLGTVPAVHTRVRDGIETPSAK